MTDNRTSAITVLGPGAIGGLLAAMLVRGGEEVFAVARAGSATEIRKSGLTINSELLGGWTSRPLVTETIPENARVILSVKAFALDSAVEWLKPARPAEILTVLNGIRHLSVLRGQLPGTRVIPASITVEARRHSATLIEHCSPFIRLSVPDLESDREIVKALQRAGVDVSAGGTEDEVLWRKYRFLAPMALLTALHEAPIGEALRRDAGLSAAVIAETAAASTAAGLPTSAAELTRILEGLPPSMRSSLQLDIATAIDCELEALGGALLEFAALASVHMPVCSGVVEMLRMRRWRTFRS